MKFRLTTVVKRFRDPETGVPKELLACGHVRTDPELHYGNVASFRINRIAQMISGKPARARCYKCSKS